MQNLCEDSEFSQATPKYEDHSTRSSQSEVLPSFDVQVVKEQIGSGTRQQFEAALCVLHRAHTESPHQRVEANH